MNDFRNLRVNTDQPLVTIGMTSYNYARYIRTALDSLLTQTYAHIELIIVDDCSTDGSVDIIESWISNHQIKCTFIKHTENKGITKTLNELLNLSAGKYIAFFASDDIMLPERVTRQTLLLEACGEEYGMSYARPAFIDDDSRPYWTESVPTDFFNPDGNVLEYYLKREFVFVTPSAMIRKSVYDKVGLYDERVLIEDYNFFIRLLACYKVKYCDYPCIIYRWKVNGTPVFKEWHKNNHERYFYERILSNEQALKFMPDSKTRLMLKKKISQYLKSMAVYNSPFFKKAVLHLLKRRYISIPPKIIIIKLVKKIQSALS